MSARIAAFVVWAAAAACLAYWGLRVGVAAPPLPASVQPVSTAMVLRGDVMRLFATPATPDAPAPTEPGLASRFKLVGVVAPQSGERGAGQGIALIAVDGKPPRPYRIGAQVEEALVLQAVARRGATLGPAEGLAAVRLELPPLVAPATGSLPPAPSFDPAEVARTPVPPVPPEETPEVPEGAQEFEPPPAPDPLAPQGSADDGQSDNAADDRVNRRAVR